MRTSSLITIGNEKTLVNGSVDNYGAPLSPGDKVIAIDSDGTTWTAYYIGTTPSGKTHKVLKSYEKTSMYFYRPYRGILRYQWENKGVEPAALDFAQQVLKDIESKLP